MSEPRSRRSFLSAATASVATASMATGSVLGSLADTVIVQDANQRNPICVFTKPFTSLTFAQLADRISALGFDGIEAPIRKDGHVEPQQVEQELPKLVEALKHRNLDITVLTSDINDPRDPLTERVLRVAADHGISYYRMQYFKYNESKPIKPQIAEWHKQMVDLAALNKQLGITGLYQNHAGRNYFGAGIWDLHMGLADINPTEIGVAYDIRHATAEGGMSLPIPFQLIRSHIQVVYVKDFVWEEKKPGNVPLGKGRVDPRFFDMLKKSGFAGPISLHEEYIDHKDPSLVPQHIDAIRSDLATLKTWL